MERVGWSLGTIGAKESLVLEFNDYIFLTWL